MTTYGKRFQVTDNGHLTESPEMRLLAAVLLRAVRDYFLPAKNVTNAERESAAAFVWSETGRDLLAHFLSCGQAAAQGKLIEAKRRMRENAKTS